MFDTINYLLYEKNKKELDPDLLEEFNPHITAKSFSYYDSGKYCDYINNTLNMYGSLFKTKEEQFKFFDSIIPKLKRRKSEYIKKAISSKKDNTENKHIPEFLSKRELDMYSNVLTSLK